MDLPTRKLRKTDTQSIARCLSEESISDLDQIKEIRNASYKAGFGMAVSIFRNYLRDVERGKQSLNVGKLINWTEQCQYWRHNNSLDNMPDIL